MKTLLLKSSLLTLLLCGLSAQANAGALDLKTVPADSKWLIHVDIDAGLSTTAANECKEKCAKTEKAQKKLSEIKEKLGMDPMKDLHSVTLFGNELKPGTGTMILRAKVDQEKLVARGKKHDSYKTSKIGEHEIHSVTLKHHDHEHAIHGCFYSEDVLVLSGSEAEMKTALALLDGKGKGLADTDSVLAKKPAGDAVFHMAVTGFVDHPMAKRLPAFLKGNFVSMTMGEKGGKSFGEMVMNSTDAATAELLKQVAEGGKAMIALQHGGNDPDVKWFLDATKIQTKGNTFSVSFEASATELMKRGAEMHKKHHALYDKYRKQRRDRKQKDDDDKKKPRKRKAEKSKE